MLTTNGSVPERRLSEVIAEHLRRTARVNPSDAERRSWDRSLPVLARDLVDAGLGAVEMLVEYQLPLTSKRADVVLAGVDRRTSGDAYVVVELKQWSQAELFEDDPKLVLVGGMSGGPWLHPVLQVEHYCEYIADFVAALEGRSDALRGVAYLHNATRQSVPGLFDLALDSNVRLFTKTERSAFVGYLRDRFENAEGHPAAERLVNGRVQPNRPLLEKAANVLKGRDKFILVDQQQKAFETVRHAVEGAFAANTKRVVTITGGPGSGKTAVAIELLHYMASANSPEPDLGQRTRRIRPDRLRLHGPGPGVRLGGRDHRP
ncbi:hypothetical protein [Streptosporangium sp. OZ121]|uniref:hypothetical protein n=1 Tax=Streptosporangium sp. OZ121 TaxID=3444183 RepID=UPI003F7ADE88